MSKQEVLTEAAKSAPPITTVGLTIAGIHLSDMVMLLTGIYTACQLILTVPKLCKMWKDWRNGRNRSPPR